MPIDFRARPHFDVSKYLKHIQSCFEMSYRHISYNTSINILYFLYMYIHTALSVNNGLDLFTLISYIYKVQPSKLKPRLTL